MRVNDHPTLRVLAWDHPRCLTPLAAARDAYRALTGIDLEISVRSLAGFGDDVPTSGELDLVLIDHPHIGEAVAGEQIVALDGLLAAETIKDCRDGAIGPSGWCYEHAGSTWAIPIDAACQVLACSHTIASPVTVEEVVALAQARPGRVALPLHPAHALSAFVSIVAALGADDAVTGFGDESLAVEALDVMARLVALGPTVAQQWDPPAALAALEGQAVDCVPWTYGYVGYDVQWADAPAWDEGGTPGCILGGVGMAVLSGANDPVAAAAFAAWFGGTHTQRTIVTTCGGQPAEFGAWAASPDPLCETTVRSMEAAVVRPRATWWPALQIDAGELIRANLIAGVPANETAERLHERYDQRLESVTL